MSGAVRDLLHAWRGLRQKPGFLVASLLTLAIGIGANVTIFSLVNGLSLRPMPFGDRTDRLVTIHPTHRFEMSRARLGRGRDLVRRPARLPPGALGRGHRRLICCATSCLSGDDSSAERVLGGSVSPDLFPMLGIEPFMGRQFRAGGGGGAGPRVRGDADARPVAAALWIRSGDRRQDDHGQRSRPRRDRRAAAGYQVSADRSALHAVPLG